jgi:formylglycine-generating enzyme required for sulfatase activity
MVTIPAGRFAMGSPATEPGHYMERGEQHAVTIPRAFAVGKYEVTFAEWDACVADGGCGGYRPGDNGWGRGNRPVINVSWNDAKSYVMWLSGKTGKLYRLLSESEWEYAARAGTTTPYYWGERASHELANYGKDECCDGLAQGADQWVNTSPVGSFPPNGFGLYDMAGNVEEWCEDNWHAAYAGNPPSDGSVWAGGDNTFRVVRGGSWYRDPLYLRSAGRGNYRPDDRGLVIGFRVARTL